MKSCDSATTLLSLARTAISSLAGVGLRLGLPGLPPPAIPHPKGMGQPTHTSRQRGCEVTRQCYYSAIASAHCDFHSRWFEAPTGVTWATATWATATYTHGDEKGADEEPPPPPPLLLSSFPSHALLLSSHVLR